MNYKFFLLILLIISALAAVALWQAPDLSNPESLKTILSRLQEISSSDDESSVYQEFSEAEFKIEYPSNWTTIKEGGFLQTLAPEEWAEKYDLKALFLAQGFQQEKSVQLVVYKGTFEISIEEIFEKMKETNKSNGWTVEVLESKTSADEGTFEGKYKNQAGTLSHSKEKVLIKEKEGYLISLFGLEKDWRELQETVDKILNSATI